MRVAVVAVALFAGASVLARCASCAEKMAIKQSIKDAAAAAIAAGKIKPGKKDHEIHTLEEAQEAHENEPCCAACAEGGECEGKRCPCDCASTKAPRQDMVASDSCNNCCAQVSNMQCALDNLVANNAWCCKKINHRLKKQGHEAEKCCRHTRHELNEIEDLIISQTDEAAVCCSVTETLLVSVLDVQDTCCTNIQDQLTTISTTQTTCCSTIEGGLTALTTLVNQILTIVTQILACTCD